jgi:penicillin-binding protein 1C
VNLLERVGLGTGYAFLRDLGLYDGDVASRHWGLGLAIGAAPTTLARLVRAYTVLADDGRLSDLVWWDGVPAGGPRRLLSEAVARQVTLFLSDPMARLPTFPRMGASEYPFPVAVKTGTSSGYRDALTVAWSMRWIVGVWIGDPDARPMGKVTAFSSAAMLAQAILRDLHPDQAGGLDDLQFPPPRGFRPVRLCALTGKRATSACGQVVVEWFRPGEEPSERCDAHVELAVDARDGLLASSFTPATAVEVRGFTALPARYAAWATAAGLPRAPTTVSPLDAPPGAVVAPDPPPLRGTPRLRIVTPRGGTRVVRDPESPPDAATLALRVVVDPPARQVVWYVDDAPFEVVDYPYVARWALHPGVHVFQARLPWANVASPSVRVLVQ